MKGAAIPAVTVVHHRHHHPSHNREGAVTLTHLAPQARPMRPTLFVKAYVPCSSTRFSFRAIFFNVFPSPLLAWNNAAPTVGRCSPRYEAVCPTLATGNERMMAEEEEKNITLFFLGHH